MATKKKKQEIQDDYRDIPYAAFEEVILAIIERYGKSDADSHSNVLGVDVSSPVMPTITDNIDIAAEIIKKTIDEKHSETKSNTHKTSLSKKKIPTRFSITLIERTLNFLRQSKQIKYVINKKIVGSTDGAPDNIIEHRLSFITPNGKIRSVDTKKQKKITGVVLLGEDGRAYFKPFNNPKHTNKTFRLISQSDGLNHIDQVVSVELYGGKDEVYDVRIDKSFGNKNISDLISRIMALVDEHSVDLYPGGEDIEAVREAISHISLKVSENDPNDPWSIKNMKDRFPNFIDARDLPFVTIDPKTCKDMDDAVCVIKNPDGSYTQYVAISLVSVYVEKFTAILKDAFSRGNSTYFADMVAPMLMEELSNIIGSLNAGEDRLAFITRMDFDKDGNLINSSMGPGVMRSRHKFAYEDVDKIFEGNEEERSKHPEEILKSLDSLKDLGRLVRAKRIANGSTEFRSGELTYRLNKSRDGVEEAFADNSTEAHKAIEDAMLIANKVFAEYCKQKGIEIIYRVEEGLSEEKTNEVLNIIKTTIPEFFVKNEIESFSNIQNLVNSALDYAENKQGEIFARALSEMIIKCLPKARYDPNGDLGHFALNFDAYAHTTSPIRRFADLVNQLQVLASFAGEPSPFDKETLQKMCEHINYTERNSDALEAKVQDLLCAWFINQKIRDGQDMTKIGYISNISTSKVTVKTDYGNVVIDLENKSKSKKIKSGERDLDEFVLSADRMSVSNGRGVTYKLGSAVKVKPTKIDLDNRIIYAQRIGEKNLGKINVGYDGELDRVYGGGHGNGRNR